MFREQDLIYTYCCFLLLSVSLFFEFSSSDMLRNNQLCIRVALLLWFVMSSRAIMVTSPSQGTTWSATGEHTVSWVEVNTDPTTFAISLVRPLNLKSVISSGAIFHRFSSGFSSRFLCQMSMERKAL